MKKLSEILALVELFYKKAMRAFGAEPMAGHYMPDDPEEEDNGLTGNITVDAEKFDIKDEKLFEQFESFMTVYNELIDALSIDPENLTPEALQEAGELIKTLETRYERLITNPYLNATDDSYSEDFDPGDLTSFIQNVFQDAEKKLETLAGEDVSIEEIMQANLPQEFNTQVDLAGNSAAEKWSAERIYNAMQYRKTWAEGLAEAKKFGPAHNKWESYQKFVATRKRGYASMMADPARRTKYLERCKVRFKDWFNNINQQKVQLESLLEVTTDPKKREEISSRLQKYNSSLQKHLARRKRYQDKRKELWDSSSLPGAVQRLRTKLDTAKSEAVKKIKAKAAQDPIFAPYKKAVQTAKEKLDQDPSPTNKAAHDQAIKAEAAAITAYLNENEVVIQVKQDMATISSFKDKVMALTTMESSKETAMATSNEKQALSRDLISAGQQLINTYGKVYRAPMAAVGEIIEELRKQL